MRPLRALAVYIAVVFIGGALLAPWLYWLVQLGAGVFPKLAHSPFHRFVHRSLLGLAILGVWPLLKASGTASLRDAGLVRPGGQWGRLGGGLLLGFVSLALVAGFALASGARQFNTSLSAGQWVAKIAGITLTALVVAVLEEILFRGAIYGALKKIFHWRFALVLSSVLYAFVHFISPATSTEPVTWISGLELLPRMLRGFADAHALLPGFFNLTLAGVLLGLAYQRTGNLYFSIGLHAGWIFWLKAYGAITHPVPGANSAWWGMGAPTNGWFALPVLAATIVFFMQLRAGRKQGFGL
ncbi:MAG TPA: type II CAAX endopeptidase family protein [Verrucomicrobiae bacterium]|nr:type II CAAX endopeptidase family protein [Verrucomicrobiae bacterium]